MPRLVLVVAIALTLSSHHPAAKEQVARLVIDGLAGPVQATSINNGGTIVGSMSPGGEAVPQVPFRWTKTGGVEFFLGNSPGIATDVNDAGAIVGYLQSGDEPFVGFLWTRQHGFVNLGTAFLPTAINNRGQIVGTIVGDSGATGPYLWDNGALTKLGDDAASGIASDISAAGRVVGQQVSPGLGSAFLWSPQAGLTLLPSSTGSPDAISGAVAINNSGEVVGFETEAVATAVFTPVRWTSAGEIQTFPQFQGTFVAINARGLAAGRYLVQIAANQFVWHGFATTRDGQVVTLGLGIPVAVNDRGAILGTTEIDGVSQVVVWLVGPSE